ncbi:MAG: thioredoxin family protein [Candidatus Neomarinimicrobiota bacterium]|nr:MAG: thioredoxin family protein [Candidatus Neomarinimicrobiota bacterium]
MNVKVLGTGCSKCQALERKLMELAPELPVELEIEKVTDINKMMEYGIMMTPGLVIDGELKSSGIIPSDDQLKSWFQEAATHDR